MAYEAVGFDPAANVLAPSVQSFLNARYPPIETSTVVPVAAFAPSWTNFGGGYAPAAYATIGTRVFLRGLVTTSAALSGPSTILTLPAGFQPAKQELFVCTLGGGSSIRVDVFSVGNGSVAIGQGASVAAGTFLSLSGINFSTLA